MEHPDQMGGKRGHRMTESRGLEGQVQESELELKEEKRLEPSRVGFAW